MYYCPLVKEVKSAPVGRQPLSCYFSHNFSWMMKKPNKSKNETGEKIVGDIKLTYQVQNGCWPQSFLINQVKSDESSSTTNQMPTLGIPHCFDFIHWQRTACGVFISSLRRRRYCDDWFYWMWVLFFNGRWIPLSLIASLIHDEFHID